MVPQTLIKFDNYLFFVRFVFLPCAPPFSQSLWPLVSDLLLRLQKFCIWWFSLFRPVQTESHCVTGPGWPFWQEWCEYHMIEYQTPIDAWTLLKWWQPKYEWPHSQPTPPPWVHCLAIFTHVRALSLCLTILPGILRSKIYRLLSHVACTWAGLRGVSHPSSAAFPRLLTQCSAFKWPLIGCDCCSAFRPSEYFCNK